MILEKAIAQRSKARGAALIELMLVTPVLILLIASVTEIGWALHEYKTLTRATRNGVRYVAGKAMQTGVGFAVISSNLADKTRKLVVYGNPDGSGNPLLPNWSTTDVTVTLPDTQHVQVTATYQYRPVVFAHLPFFDSGDAGIVFELRGSTVMRAL